MKIGIDVDGVIIDFVHLVRAHAELYDLLELKKNGVINKNGFKVKDRYEWTKEELQAFADKYFVSLTQPSPLMPCVKEVLELLKKDGHELIIVTARGGIHEAAISEAEKVIDNNQIKIDKFIWNAEDKIAICKKEKIDIMIDDSWEVCEKASSEGIFALYFKGRGNKSLIEKPLLKEVENWGEIYRYIVSISNKNSSF